MNQISKITILTGLLVTMLFSSVSFGQNAIDYTDLDKVFKRIVVREKYVDYLSLIDDHDGLFEYLDNIRDIPRNQIDQLPENDRLAFWINTFNAITLRAIVEAWPVMSIQQIKDFREREWKIASRPTTLDNIRMKYLGFDIGDPRAYLATCDGSAGSPPLKPYAFIPILVQQQLDELTKEVINNPLFTVLKKKEKAIEINQTLYWFREFFIKKYPKNGRFVGLNKEQAAIMNFIEEYAEGTLKTELLKSDKWEVTTGQYLWVINSNKKPPVSQNPNAQKKPTQ